MGPILFSRYLRYFLFPKWNNFIHTEKCPPLSYHRTNEWLYSLPYAIEKLYFRECGIKYLKKINYAQIIFQFVQLSSLTK